MRTTTMLLAIGCVGAIALGMLVRAEAQYYYPRPPDYAYDYPPLDDRYGYGWTWNDCPRGGRCRAETVRPTKVRSAEGGIPGTVARTVTQSKRESANRIEDISSLWQTVAAPIFIN